MLVSGVSFLNPNPVCNCPIFFLEKFDHMAEFAGHASRVSHEGTGTRRFSYRQWMKSGTWIATLGVGICNLCV